MVKILPEPNPAERVTYSVSSTEPLHSDASVVVRMVEVGISRSCGFGCKIYADPRSNVRVLAHASAYGCPF